MKIWFLLLIINFSVIAQGDWQLLTQTNLTLPASELFFINENKGWLAGSDGVIYYTDDGGNNWIVQRDTSSAQGDLNDVFFINENTGWACGADGTVLYTNDGGSTWNQSTSTSTSEDLNAITFIDGNNGFACGNNGVIIKTTNGGISWISLITNTFANLGGISFWDANNGFAIINSNVNGVLWTNSAGFLWTIATLPIPSGLISSRMYGCDAIQGTSQGWIGGYYGLVFKTTNKAQSWTLIANLFGAEYKQIRDIDFADSQTGFACGSSGAIFRTLNGGTNWDTLSCGSAQTISKISAVSSQNVMVSGLYSQLRKTNDGGNTWTPIVDWPRVSFRGIGIADSLHITACSFGGDITYSDNAGQTFSFPGNSTIPSTGNLNCVYFKNPNLGFVAGQDAEISKSTDGGNTWTATNVNATDYKTVYAISMINTATGWAGASSGVIYKTTDGGDNWSQIHDLGSDLIYDIYFLTDQIGFAVSNSGNIFKCTDGNVTWNVVANFPDVDFYGLDFADAQNAFATGEDGLLAKTLNGGDSWEISDTLGFMVGDSLYLPDLRDVTFINSLEGWIVGRYGATFYTSDGGKTWQYVDSQTDETLYEAEFLTSTYGYIAGGNGTILKYNPVSSIGSRSIYHPSTIKLFSNYPNPFNPGTNIEYQINISGLVNLEIYDIQGRKVRTLISDYQKPGYYKYFWDGKNDLGKGVSSGTYFYQLEVDDYIVSKRMILMK